MIFAAARYLARAPVASLPESIYDLLLSDNNPMRARAAAVVLANVQTTGMRARIRLALLSAGKVHIPRLAPDNLAVWLEELKGAFRLEAMSALEAQGEQTWIQLAFAWNEAGPELRTWLLQWGFRDFLPMLPSLLPQALRDSDRTVVLEGVRAMADAGERIVPESIRGLAGTFLSDPDPALREAAVAAAPPGIDWREFLASETNCAVRFAAIAQLARTECEHAIPDLIQFLRSSDWQARAVAAGCLITLGTAAVDAVKPLVRDADQNVRTAAVRILIAFQQDAWLEKELLI